MVINNSTIATAGVDITIKIWNVTTGDCTANLKGHYKTVCSLCYINGTNIASGGADKYIIIWNAFNSNIIKRIDGHTHIVRYFFRHISPFISFNSKN